MSRTPAIATYFLLTLTAVVVADASPLRYGDSGGDPPDSATNAPPPGRPLPDNFPVLNFDEKQILGRRDVAPSAAAATYHDSAILGDPKQGIPRVSPPQSNGDSDPSNLENIRGFHVGEANSDPAGIPIDRVLASAAEPHAPLKKPSSHDPGIASPDADNTANSAPASWTSTLASEEYGILDNTEFAAGLALFSGGVVIFLITRAPLAQRRAMRRNLN